MFHSQFVNTLLYDAIALLYERLVAVAPIRFNMKKGKNRNTLPLLTTDVMDNKNTPITPDKKTSKIINIKLYQNGLALNNSGKGILPVTKLSVYVLVQNFQLKILTKLLKLVAMHLCILKHKETASLSTASTTAILYGKLMKICSVMGRTHSNTAARQRSGLLFFPFLPRSD